jgi:hypothetical protein
MTVLPCEDSRDMEHEFTKVLNIEGAEPSHGAHAENGRGYRLRQSHVGTSFSTDLANQRHQSARPLPTSEPTLDCRRDGKNQHSVEKYLNAG